MAQAITVLALPLLTRLYSPEDFNLLAVYVAILSIITVISCLRYNIAIPLPESDSKGMALLCAAVISAVSVSSVCALVTIIAPEGMARLLGQPDIEPYLWMISVGVLIASLYEALQYWSSRKKRFSLISRTRVTRAFGGLSAQVGIGLLISGPFGLIFGHMIYGGLGVIGLLRNLFRNDSRVLQELDRNIISRQIVDYRRFPIYSVPETLLNTAGTQLPIIIIAAATAGPEAAYLFLAMRVVGLPLGIIGNSVAQVYLAEAPTKLKQGELGRFTKSTMLGLVRIGAPLLILLGIFSPIAFELVFGTGWARAGWIVTLLVPYFLLQFIVSPVSMALHVMGKQGLALGIQAVGFLLRVGGLFFCTIWNTAWVVEFFAVVSTLFYLLYLLLIVKISSGNSEQNESVK